MSLDAILMLPPGYGFDSAGGGSPTVYILTVGNSGDIGPKTGEGYANLKFKLDATTDLGGPETTATFIEIDSGAGSFLTAAEQRTQLLSALEALSNVGSGMVTISSNGGPGTRYEHEITFDVSLGSVVLDFNASSQWYPTVLLVEAVTQQGIMDVTGASEVFTVSSGSDGQTDFTDGTNAGNVVCAAGILINVNAPSGYSVSAGGSGSGFVTFTADSSGDRPDQAITSGDASLNLDTQGVDPVTGQQEVHTITPTPVNPTGGTWQPLGGGSSIAYDAVNGDIATQIGTAFDPLAASNPTVSGSLGSGPVEVTAPSNGNLSDTALSPVNISLTAPEISHSIT